jgi:hypothetical protein
VTDRIRGAPDLVVQILSPHPRIGEKAERLGLFAAYGVDECWMVHLAPGRVEILTLAGGAVA